MSKPFDLEKVLAGEPVKLRNGTKAIVYSNVSNLCKTGLPLKGLAYSNRDQKYTDSSYYSWTLEGKFFSGDRGEHENDIVGMWEEPRPTVTLTLPCPLKEPRDEMWFISSRFTIIKSAGDGGSKKFLEEGRYFASEYDAQEWLNAMRNSSR
ncbi:TPA: pyruvate kinase [Mannheimia haemolytica]